MSYVIECQRSQAGAGGQATAPAKDKDGQVMIFESREEAENKAREWRKNTHSPNVSYRVRERG